MPFLTSRNQAGALGTHLALLWSVLGSGAGTGGVPPGGPAGPTHSPIGGRFRSTPPAQEPGVSGATSGSPLPAKPSDHAAWP